MSILILKVRKFKSDLPRGKWLKKFLKETASPPPQKLSDIFKKMVSKRMSSASSISLIFDFLTSVISWFWICCQKISKAFIMSILSLKVRKFKSDFSFGKRLKNLLTKKASLPPRNIAIFPKKASKTWKIRKVQKCPQKAPRSL